MKATLLLAALALTSACTGVGLAETAKDGTVEMITIARGSYAVETTERKAILAATDADYRRSWADLIGESEVPVVDFSSSVVVFLFAGERNTGGWSVEPSAVNIDGTTVVIDAKVQGPSPGGMVTQAITYPYAVVAIRSRTVEKVSWPQ